MKKIFFMHVWLLLMFTVLLVGCSEQSSKNSNSSSSSDSNIANNTGNESGEVKRPDTLKVGALFAMTGSGASYGDQQSKGVQLAFDEINAAGGIDGMKLELIIEDHEGLAATGVNGMNKLISSEKVPWVFTSFSNIIMATTPIGEENKVLMVNGGGTSPTLAGLSPYLFSNIPLELIHIRALADHTYNELGMKDLAILYVNDDLGVGDHDAMVKAWETLGGTIVTSEVAESTATDFRAQLTKIKATNPDAIYMAIGGQQIAIALNQAKELGINSQILGTSFWTIPDTIEAAKGSSEGVLFSSQQWDPKNPTNEMAKKFVEHYKSVYNEKPLQNSTSYYGAAYILKDALEYLNDHNKPITGEEIRNAMLAMDSFETPYGNLTFNEDGSANLPVTIMTVEDAQFKKVKDVDVEVFEQFK